MPRLYRKVLIAGLGGLAAACAVINGPPLSDAQQVMVDLPFAATDLTVSAQTDHPNRRYRAGEPIVLSVRLNKPASVAVLEVMPNGSTTLVFPNRRQPDARVAADTLLTIPAAGEALVVDTPGPVVFKVIASERPGSWLFARKPSDNADFATLGTSTRTIAKDISLSLRGAGVASAAITLAIEGG